MILPDTFKADYAPPDTTGIEPFDFALDGGGRNLLVNEIEAKGVRLMVEIGCYLCGSTRLWLGSCPDLTVIGIDPWEGDWHESLEHFDRTLTKPWSKIDDRAAVIASVREHGGYLSSNANVREYADRFFPVRGRSPAKLYELKDAGVVPDMVYFDSNKQMDDLAVAHDLWPDAILCGDDWTWGEDRGFPIRAVIEAFCETHGWRVQARGATWLIRRD